MNKFIFLIPLFASCLTIASAQSTVEKAPNPVKKSPTPIVIKPFKDKAKYKLNDGEWLRKEGTLALQLKAINPKGLEIPLNLKFYQGADPSYPQYLMSAMHTAKQHQFHPIHLFLLTQKDGKIIEKPLKDEVQQDPNVKPTIASETQDPNIAKAERIVIKVSKIDGKVSYTTEKSKELATTTDLKAYINEQIKVIKKKGLQPALHLKAHRFLPWRDIQTVQKIAAKAGILDVHFSSFKKKPPEEAKAK